MRIVVGHDMPLPNWLVLVSDVVWHQSDQKETREVWLFETGVRAQLTPSLIGAIGIDVSLNRGEVVSTVPVGQTLNGITYKD